VDFRNTVIIMTSNLGTQYLTQGGALGFRSEDSSKSQREKTRKDIEAELRRTFRPEFLNRIDDIVIFQQLTRAEVLRIVDLEVNKVAQRIGEKKVAIDLTAAARQWLGEQGYDPQFGARPLKRAIQHFLENPLSKRLIAGEFKDGEIVTVDVAGGELTFTRKPVLLEALPA
jgi:ATP-dependent Clp protease ATP-binding subunit ClpC